MNHKYPTENSSTNKIHKLTFVRYGLVILITGFIVRELVVMSATPYPGWLFVVLFVVLCGSLVPYERFLNVAP